MGEPITLYGKDGESIVVYGRAQAAELLVEGYTDSPPPIAPDSDDIATGQKAAEGVKETKAKTPRPRGRTGNL